MRLNTKTRWGTVVAFLMVGWAPVGAQTVAEQITSDVRDMGKDMVAIWMAPFRGSAKDWAITAGALGAAGIISVVDDDLDRWAVRHQGDPSLSFLKELRRGGIAYGGGKLGPVALGAYVFGVATNNQSIRDGLFGCVASYTSQSLARGQVLYRLVARARPDTARSRDEGVAAPPPAVQGDQYDFKIPGSSDWGVHSFPGGHVANVTSCASFLNHRFKMGAVEPVLYAVAAGVGVGRILDRGHWASDQVIGSLLGYAVGREVARRSLNRLRAPGSSPSADAANFSVAPNRGGVVLQWQRVF
jgi:membrane-associated phospholipid phosphatase